MEPSVIATDGREKQDNSMRIPWLRWINAMGKVHGTPPFYFDMGVVF